MTAARKVAPVDGMPEREPGPKPGTCGHPHPAGDAWCFRPPHHPPPHTRGSYVWLSPEHADDVGLPVALSAAFSTRNSNPDLEVALLDYQLDLLDSIDALAVAMEPNQVRHFHAMAAKELRTVLADQRNELLGRLHDEHRQP